MLIFKKIASVTFIALIFLLLLSNAPTLAQEAPEQNANDVTEASLGLAHMYEIKDKNVKDGSLLTSTEEGAALTTIPYDAQILGVVARDASIIIATEEGPNSVPVISNGLVYVLVSTADGDIKKGDIITSSIKPGVATKATKSGYVLGYAMEDYSNPDPEKIGKIVVNLSLHYYNSRSTLAGTLTDILKIAILPTKDSPNALFKYFIAGLVVILSFLFAFLTFGRMAAKGIEALGRNPSASATIHLGIIFNVVIVIAIILVGLIVAFFILRL